VIHTIFFNRDDFHRVALKNPWIEIVEETSLSDPNVGFGLYRLHADPAGPTSRSPASPPA
jgi:hypothetical protein